MRSSVRAIFPTFSRHFEGATSYPYLDVEGYVTTAIGCLIDPVGLALPLPWQIGGRPATEPEVLAGWQAVKGAPGELQGDELAAWLEHHAAGYYAQLSQLRLTDAAVDALLVERLASFEQTLIRRFGSEVWEAAPASAQLAALSMCWADGAGGVVTGFPRFCAAFAMGAWATCAAESHLEDSHNPGLVARNAANLALLHACDSTDPDVVAWP